MDRTNQGGNNNNRETTKAPLGVLLGYNGIRWNLLLRVKKRQHLNQGTTTLGFDDNVVLLGYLLELSQMTS